MVKVLIVTKEKKSLTCFLNHWTFDSLYSLGDLLSLLYCVNLFLIKIIKTTKINKKKGLENFIFENDFRRCIQLGF
jgi:ATP/ADP translocase